MYSVVALSLLLLGGTQEQPTPVAAPPTDWLQGWRDATVAIGRVREGKRPDGTVIKYFHVVGTGVLFGVPGDAARRVWLVTAKHVFSNPKEKWEPEALRLRFAWFADRPVNEYFGVEIALRRDEQRLWYSHPDPGVDLACIPLAISKEDAGRPEVAGVGFADIAKSEELFQGAQIMVLGYPEAVGGDFWNDAVVRQGVVAWLDRRNDVNGRVLIDADVFPGNSGGPVFRVPSGMGKDGSFHIGGRAAFVGIVSSGQLQAMPITAAGAPVVSEGGGQALSHSFIGIGLLEPASRVRTLLEAALAADANRRP